LLEIAEVVAPSGDYPHIALYRCHFTCLLVIDRRTFPVLRSTYSYLGDHLRG